MASPTPRHEHDLVRRVADIQATRGALYRASGYPSTPPHASSLLRFRACGLTFTNKKRQFLINADTPRIGDVVIEVSLDFPATPMTGEARSLLLITEKRVDGPHLLDEFGSVSSQDRGGPTRQIKAGSTTFEVTASFFGDECTISVVGCKGIDFMFVFLGLQEHVRRFCEALRSVSKMGEISESTLSRQVMDIEAWCGRCEAIVAELRDFLDKNFKKPNAGQDDAGIAIVDAINPVTAPPCTQSTAGKEKRRGGVADPSPSKAKAKKVKKEKERHESGDDAPW